MRNTTDRILTVALTTLIGVLLLGSGSGCEELRPRAATGVRVGLDCEAENIQAVVQEAGALAKAFVLSTIRGDGTPDTAALREAARGLKSDGLRCAFAAAIAALATPPAPGLVGGPQTSPQLVNGTALRAIGREIATEEWGVTGPVVTKSGTL